MTRIGTWLIIGGVILLVLGVLANSGLLSWFGRLPGDIRVERDGMRFYVPITTMLVISIGISLILFFIGKFWK